MFLRTKLIYASRARTTRSGKMMVSWRAVRRHLGWLFPRLFQIFRGVGPPNLGGALLPLLLQCGMCGLWAVSVLHWGPGGGWGGGHKGAHAWAKFSPPRFGNPLKKQRIRREGKVQQVKAGGVLCVKIRIIPPPRCEEAEEILPSSRVFPTLPQIPATARTHARTHPTPASPLSPPPQEPS